MADYTSLGLEKIAQQADESPALIRCPRDGVVMRPVGGRIERRDGSGEVKRFDGRPRRSREWGVRELDLECPACRRRAERIRLHSTSPTT